MSFESFKSTLVQFRVEDAQVNAVLTELQALGLGVSFGFCDVLELKGSTTIPGEVLQGVDTTKQTVMASSQVYSNVAKKTLLTVDTVVVVCMSSIMAGIGLSVNNRIYIMAGSLMSPLMGPIMGAAYGLAILDQELFLTGVKNTLMGLAITIIFGVLIGVSFAPFAEMLLWPTDEMATRGIYMEMMFGAIIAICGGASVAIAESNEDLSSVAGIAISSALVPPGVNCGICFAFLLFGAYFCETDIDNKLFLRIASSSLGIVAVNVFFIYATAFVVFRSRSANSRFLFKKRKKTTGVR